MRWEIPPCIISSPAITKKIIAIREKELIALKNRWGNTRRGVPPFTISAKTPDALRA